MNALAWAAIVLALVADFCLAVFVGGRLAVRDRDVCETGRLAVGMGLVCGVGAGVFWWLSGRV